jgi:arylsulfatase A-like enzyme
MKTVRGLKKARIIKRREFLKTLGYGAAALSSGVFPASCRKTRRPPNIIYILADDLGYGDLGCYGQEIIQTTSLDRMAAEGMRFTQHYAGSTVCAPSRCVLMTGYHAGHCRVRGNAAGAAQALTDPDVTAAEVLKQAGYATALIGKWGLGDDVDGAREGLPNRQGFDDFYGYLNQVHAHNYYPEFLWRNAEKEPLRNKVQREDRGYGGFIGGAAVERIDYSHDLFAEEALGWIERHRDGPFFLYLALTIPHANNEASRMFGNGAEVPDYGPYADRDWPDPDKGQAAMITRMDRDIGRILDRLKKLGIAENTLVMFSSDNGPHNEASHNPERFRPSGPLRGMKRDLYEGGVRVPFIAWWPGTIPAGAVSDLVCGFQDMLPTWAELARIQPPPATDGLSLVPTLTAKSGQKVHPYLYWEFYEQCGKQAVLMGKWKGVRLEVNADRSAPIQLYDIENDIGETRDLASEYPEIVRKISSLVEEAHTPSPRFRFDWEKEQS